MRPWIGLVGALLLSVAGVARADDPDGDRAETVTGKALPTVKLPVAPGPAALTSAELAAFHERPYDNVVYIGAEALDIDPELVHGIRQGLDLMYRRDYKGVRRHFEELEKSFPGTGLSAVVNALVWQAIMLENFDFRYDEQYWTSSRQARADLKKALATPGGDGWDHFLMAGVAGVEAIHVMRHEKWLEALNLAFEAMDHIAKSKQKAPEFTDLLIADGMYNYWRSVLTISVPIMPDYTDNRALGIQQMQKVEAAGVFLSAPATLSLAFTWLEEHELKHALSACLRNKSKYPDNVINNLLLGQVYTYTRRYDSAHRTFQEILAVAPDNTRVHYHMGVAFMREQKHDLAEKEFKTYLGADYMEPYQRSSTHYRLGQVYYRQARYDDAEAAWKEAVRINGNEGAKKRLDRLKQSRKSGKIPG